MTTADFVAALFWPLVILFVALLKYVRDPAPRRRIGTIMLATLVLYAVLGLAYWGIRCSQR